MAFARQANARVVQQDFSVPAWEKRRVRVASVEGSPAPDLIGQASEIFEFNFNPRNFLLTHATIVASVDTLDVPDMKLGKVVVGGRRINRRYGNFRINPACDKFINNNDDCWERRVLLASSPTFVGAHNFVEHIQIEDQSKGRIIDAVCRDIGLSVYTDILIATSRDFGELIADIKSGELGTLSMGCTVDETQCTKCGHVAADETEMCDCVRYEKGNYFYDDRGARHRVAELCGHRSLSPTGGVTFIEASWVRAPAFAGAVLRNIIEPDMETDRQVMAALGKLPRRWNSADRQKAATTVVGRVEDYPGRKTLRAGVALVGATGLAAARQKAAAVYRRGQAPLAIAPYIAKRRDEEPEEAPEEEAPAEEVDPLDGLVQKIEDQVLDDVADRLEQKIRERGVEDALNPEDSSAAPNQNLNKGAASPRRMYVASLKAISTASKSDAALMNSVAFYNQSLGVEIPVSTYRSALRIGSVKRYSRERFFDVCTRAFGRRLSRSEHRTMLGLCTLFSHRGDISPRLSEDTDE